MLALQFKKITNFHFSIEYYISQETPRKADCGCHHSDTGGVVFLLSDL